VTVAIALLVLCAVKNALAEFSEAVIVIVAPVFTVTLLGTTCTDGAGDAVGTAGTPGRPANPPPPHAVKPSAATMRNANLIFMRIGPFVENLLITD
jgi:hypothetical protein